MGSGVIYEDDTIVERNRNEFSANEIIRLINLLSIFKDQKIENLKSYIDFLATKINYEQGELEKLIKYLEEIEANE